MINELSEHNYPSNKRRYYRIDIAEFYRTMFSHQSEEVLLQVMPTDSSATSISPELNLPFKKKCKKQTSSSCVGSFLYAFDT